MQGDSSVTVRFGLFVSGFICHCLFLSFFFLFFFIGASGRRCFVMHRLNILNYIFVNDTLSVYK